MVPLSYPLQFLVVALAGWIHQQQRDVIDYLQAENRVLREQLGPAAAPVYRRSAHSPRREGQDARAAAY